jgi:hypothetical protein
MNTSANQSNIQAIDMPSLHTLDDDRILAALLIYVRKFMNKTDIKWQCVHDFSLYVVEVSYW